MLRRTEWGPRLWRFLHACTFAFPEKPTPEQTRAFKQLLEALQIILPCPECKVHFGAHLTECPVEATCGSILQKWLVDFHNKVNTRLNKPVMTLVDAAQMYSAEDSTGGAAMCSWWTIILLTLISIFIGVIVGVFIIRRFR